MNSFSQDFIFDGLDIPIFIIGRDGNISKANARARALDPDTDFLHGSTIAFECWMSHWAEERGMAIILKRGYRYLCRLDQVYKLLTTSVRDKEGRELGAAIQFIDYTGEYYQLEKMEQMAKIDALTGFFNRMEYDNLIAKKSNASSPMGVMMIDVNGLKAVNDCYGHRAGDTLIRMISSIIRRTLPQSTDLYRVGGDEFVAILPGADRNRMQELVPRLLAAAQKPDNGDPISLAIGCADRDTSTASIAQLVSRADKRMYKMKRDYYADERNNRRKMDE